MTDAIRFSLDGEIVQVDAVDPARTVLEYLREDRQRLGTKEGCAEGDCGACTVVIAELNDSGDQLQYRAINSCIQFLPTLHGKALITVESLQSGDGQLHPVQQAMVDQHGSQCGFCTPGFVMSMFAMYKTQLQPTRKQIDTALSGNLCRCTGYRPIVDAAHAMYELADNTSKNSSVSDPAHFASTDNVSVDHNNDPMEKQTIEMLRHLSDAKALHTTYKNKQFFAPASLQKFSSLVAQHTDAQILAGGTDIGLWVTKQYREIETIIYSANVPELATVSVNSTHIEIGAAVTLSNLMPVLIRYYPDIEELLLRFASPPIRNAATLGGNIANGSPIGDSMPVLIVMGTTLVLRKADKTRKISLDEFYLDYMKTAIEPGEFIERIRIPRPGDNQIVRTYKLSKRFDQDISAVCGAYSLQLIDGHVHSIGIAYGGLAAIPKRALQCEAAFKGKPWTEDTVHCGMQALEKDYTPIGDMRASAEYRALMCKNLLQRFYLSTCGSSVPGSVYDYEA